MGKLTPESKVVLLYRKNDLDSAACEVVCRELFSRLTAIPMGGSDLKDYDADSVDCDFVFQVCLGPVPDSSNKGNRFAFEGISCSGEASGVKSFHKPNTCAARTLKIMMEKGMGVDVSYLDRFLDLVEDRVRRENKNPDSAVVELLFRKCSRSVFVDRFGDPLFEITDSDRDLLRAETENAKRVIDAARMMLGGRVLIVEDSGFSEFAVDLIFEEHPEVDVVCWLWFEFGGSVRARNGLSGFSLHGIVKKCWSNSGSNDKAGGFKCENKEEMVLGVDRFVKTVGSVLQKC